MRAVSENLTPLTLELGGKSRVPIERSADLSDAVHSNTFQGNILSVQSVKICVEFTTPSNGADGIWTFSNTAANWWLKWQALGSVRLMWFERTGATCLSTAVEATIATVGTKSSFSKVSVIALPKPSYTGNHLKTGRET